MWPGIHSVKHILFITGTRADFGKLEPLARRAASDGFEVTFFVTGMHMMQKYGLTKLEVHRASFAKVVEFTNHRPGDNQDIVLAKTVTGLSDYLQEYDTDLIVIHGDRIEALAAAIVSSTNNKLSAHIEGGEVSGTLDESIRHCVTKLSSHHFVSSRSAALRIRQLGEEPQRIHVIGSPEIDIHADIQGNIELDTILEYYQIPFENYGICIFHPVTTELETIQQQSEVLFQSLLNSDRNYIVIAPNNDPGAECIQKEIAKLPTEKFRHLPSMRFEYFSVLLDNAKCIIGNSSAGVREAPFFGIPTIDIGSRQNNRSQHFSIKNIKAEDKDKIVQLIQELWGRHYPRSTLFGTGNSRELFSSSLSKDEFWEASAQKVFYDAD